MTNRAAKRTYSVVEVTRRGDAYAVTLDGRPVRTPAGGILAVSTTALVEALATEWTSQGDVIRPTTMPLTRLCATTIDRVVPERPAVIEGLVVYAATDLVCYRADQPADLQTRQDELWQPLLSWFEDHFGVHLAITTGVVPVAQDWRVADVLRPVLNRRGDFPLAALASAVEALGSLVIGLALAADHIGPEEAFTASQVDEDHQIARWGADSEAADRRRRLHDDVVQAARLDRLVRDAGGDG